MNVMAAAPMVQPQPGANNNTLETAWQIFAQNLNTGVISFIEMPFHLKNVFGKRGLDLIAARFCNLIQAPVETFEDPGRGIIQIIPSRRDHGHEVNIEGARDSKVKTAKKAKVARPANAFILYRQHHHPMVKAQDPNIHNNRISQILGDQWKREDPKTKARFIQMAEKLKAKHLLEHPEYQYQPRKPSEKKRRMTQRKKAALAEASNSKPKASMTPPIVVLDDPSSADEPTAPVPDFPETLGGNAMMDIGDENLDEASFTAMLEQYNNTQPRFNNAIDLVTRDTPPVMYAEPTEEAQGQKNFYSNFQTFNPFNENDYVSANMNMGTFYHRDEMLAWDLQLQAKFDKERESLFNAEADRMCQWNQETFATDQD